MGKVFYIMGKSSSGKDTIYRRVKQVLPNLKSLVTYTTRPIREGETNGVEYFFVKNTDIERLKQENKVIELREYNTIHGVWRYAAIKDSQLDTDDDILTIGTLQSYIKLKEYLGDYRLVPIYIEVDDIVRIQRAIDREKNQPKPKVIELCRRFIADNEDFSEKNLIECGITPNIRIHNEDLDTCVEDIIKVIKESDVIELKNII